MPFSRKIQYSPSCPASDGDCALTFMIYSFRMRVMASAAAAEHHLQMIALKIKRRINEIINRIIKNRQKIDRK